MATKKNHEIGTAIHTFMLACICIALVAAMAACDQKPQGGIPETLTQPSPPPATTMAGDSKPSTNVQEPKIEIEQPLAAFVAARYPDTIDAQGPYRVYVRQLAGPDVVAGRVDYSVWNVGGVKIAEGQAELQAVEGEKVWTAEIPGQSLGSTITYSFSMVTRTGQTLRHPARAPASYRFRVVALKVLSVTLPKLRSNTADRQTITLKVQSVSPPSGEILLRLLSSFSATSDEHRIPFSSVEPQDSGGDLTTYVIKAVIPNLQPGEIADFYFQLSSADGTALRVPADAPVRVYSAKNAIRPVQFLPGHGSFVLDIAAFGRQRWIGLKGEGVLIWEALDRIGHWGLEDGLPSGIARFVLPDQVSGQVYVGTDRGVVTIEADGNSWLAVSVPYPSGWRESLPVLSQLGREFRAGPGALSTLDGTLLFQIQGQHLLEQAFPAAVFLQLRDGQLDQWQPPRDLPLVGLSSATFDAVDGCWLLAGFVPDSGHDLRPVVIRRCGEEVEPIVLKDFPIDASGASPTRVVAVARDPSTGGMVVGLEFFKASDPQRRTEFGVYRLDATSGQLSPLTTESAVVSTEVTSVVTDWSRSGILVGTFGQGLLLVQDGVMRRLQGTENLPSEITTVEMDEESGSILLGTSRGVFELSSDGVSALSLLPSNDEPILAESLPMDVNLETGRVLLSSYTYGLVQLEREENGRWRIADRLRPGRELPNGLFGDAQYIPKARIGAIVYSQGLLQVENSRTTLLGPTDGLYSAEVLRFLARDSGDIWLAYTPSPFGTNANAAVQILKDGLVVRTVVVNDRDLATIGRWVEIPERNSVFAATRAGVVEILADGSMTRLSQSSATSIARDPHIETIGVVGTTVEHWDGKRFVPVLFRVDHPRWPIGQFHAGVPIDLAIDRAGVWYLLFSGGTVALLDSEGRFLGLLDPEDGIPSTARRLLAHPTTGDVFVGSGGEGLAIIAPGGSP